MRKKTPPDIKRLAMREEYLALPTDQAKANYLWYNRIGGAALNLSPSQYPHCEPEHKRCYYCGGEGKAVRVTRNTNEPNDWRIQCQTCGRHTERSWSTQTAWRDWDDQKILDGEQLSLFDILGR